MILDVLGARPRQPREVLMGSIGRFFGTLCYVGGWFGPMYAAGRLEAMNVGQYEAARDLAGELGWGAAAACLQQMTIEEARHEQWFGVRCRGHRLLPFAVRLFGWRPPGPDPAEFSGEPPTLEAVSVSDASRELTVRVIPRARKDAVGGERGGRLLVRTTAAPVDGRANAAVCKLVAAHLGIPARKVDVVAGHRSRDKTLRIGG